MTDVKFSQETVEQVRRELETALELAGQAKASIERAIRSSQRQAEEIKELRRMLGV